MADKIKVLHLITRLDRGGSAQNTLLTCLGLNGKYELVLVHGLSLESQMTDWEKQSVDRQIKRAEEGGVKLTAIPSLVRSIDPVQDLRAFFSLWRLIVKEKPAIIHTHTSKAGLLGRLAAKMAGVPMIVHTPHGHVFYGHFGPLTSRFFVIIEKLTASIMDRMVALTEAEGNDYNTFLVCNPDKMVTIHSGVDIARYAAARVDIEEKKTSIGLDPEGLVVGTVGWLLPIKGPVYLLKAMARIWDRRPDIGLVFVGKGELEESLMAEAFRRGVSDKVKFLGWRDDIPEIMQILDVFVLPSLNEGMGRVLVEAMAAGKPIVASDTGGIPDLIIDGYNGLLVPPRDSSRLTEAITMLLEDTLRREEMGKNGKLLAQGYSVESMVNKIDTLYQTLLTQKGYIQA
jgi:glycosyltransferase involved in cell wall biosynthesis